MFQTLIHSEEERWRGERERRRMGIIVSLTLIDRERGGMSEGWRSDIGRANEHHIPTLSMGTNKKSPSESPWLPDFGTI